MPNVSNSTSETQRVLIALSRDMYDDIKALAKFNRRSMTEEVRIAIEKRLDITRGVRNGK